eukprot:TRINITY_DN349_c0_g2_i4.p1 TRINITY_DN349_c0_g2~~TRINITY_DN349_c0_g2_i4.p1  ORF type:complete len:185 (+),score=45.73 TRINITY_DN349_c0_g2_i4:233-787(+)
MNTLWNRKNSTHTDRTGRDVWHPYVNDPSGSQKTLELLSYGIILAAVPAFLGGIFGIFVMGYGFALGVMGMLAWTRRHAIILSISLVFYIMWLIIAIILNAVRRVETSMPFVGNTYVGDSQTYTGRYSGSRVLSYIDHGILIVLSALALLFALKVATEKRPEPGTLVHQSTTTTKTFPGEPVAY